MARTQPNGSNRSEHVSWALAYPFHVPDGSFLYADGAVFPLEQESVEAWWEGSVSVDGRSMQIRALLETADIAADQIELDRVPVIACGSNASPQRLKQKFDQDLPGSLVPTFRVTLTNYTVVFAAKFTEYGSVPATLAHIPGAKSEVYVNFLTYEQLSIMDGTETLGCSYDRPILDGAHVETENRTELKDVHAYISRHGCFTPHGEPVSLASVKSENNPLTTMEQPAVQHAAKRVLESSVSLEDFVFENISNADLRRQRSQYLAEHYSTPAGRHLVP